MYVYVYRYACVYICVYVCAYVSQEHDKALSRDRLKDMLEGDETALDWEKDTIRELSEELISAGESVETSLRYAQVSKEPYSYGKRGLLTLAHLTSGAEGDWCLLVLVQ